MDCRDGNGMDCRDVGNGMDCRDVGNCTYEKEGRINNDFDYAVFRF